ncbi:thioredoxin [Apibacter muscae]|uniref:thioredoxin n=1 Tax=Apibacter muscae TaxID=2509004 RepID=UPI0011ABA879|nr:thioredoxin [Apibacter muscae]TWP22524.1 thioredoxin [Apibacter muscae]
MALEINDQTFKNEVIDSNEPVLVDFWAEWCGPCRSLSPVIDELSEEFKGKLKVVKIDIDANQNTPVEYGIRNIPTLLFFKNGQLVEKVVGAQPKEALVEKIQNIIK